MSHVASKQTSNQNSNNVRTKGGAIAKRNANKGGSLNLYSPALTIIEPI